MEAKKVFRNEIHVRFPVQKKKKTTNKANQLLLERKYKRNELVKQKLKIKKYARVPPERTPRGLNKH